LLPSQCNEVFEAEDTKDLSLAANRPDVCAGYGWHTLNSGLPCE
jgi:hypothetical protein